MLSCENNMYLFESIKYSFKDVNWKKCTCLNQQNMVIYLLFISYLSPLLSAKNI